MCSILRESMFPTFGCLLVFFVEILSLTIQGLPLTRGHWFYATCHSYNIFGSIMRWFQLAFLIVVQTPFCMDTTERFGACSTANWNIIYSLLAINFETANCRWWVLVLVRPGISSPRYRPFMRGVPLTATGVLDEGLAITHGTVKTTWMNSCAENTEVLRRLRYTNTSESKQANLVFSGVRKILFC